MKNYLEDLVEKCKTNSDLFDKEFPTYLGKSLLEIPGINNLVMTKNEFKLVILFYGYTRSICMLYHAHYGYCLLHNDELKEISDEIEKEIQESSIEETIYNKIAATTNKQFNVFNVMIEKKFKNPGDMEPYPAISVHIYIESPYTAGYALKTTSYPKWNGTKHEYFVLKN